jgi:hypothetical protein
MITEDWDAWLRKAPAKSMFCYASGYIWLEQRLPNNASVFLVPEEVRTLAGKVWDAFEAGHVIPVQRRNAQGTLDWLAIKRAEIEPVKKPMQRGNIRCADGPRRYSRGR